MEGILMWNEEQLMLKHFSKGEVVFEKLSIGQEIEVFQNGYWHRIKVLSVSEEPFFEDWNYGSGIGCEARIP